MRGDVGGVRWVGWVGFSLGGVRWVGFSDCYLVKTILGIWQGMCVCVYKTRCSVLQCVAVCCGVMKCVAVRGA